MPNIPAVLYGGDVVDSKGKAQETLTQRVAVEDEAWRFDNGRFETYIHHRIVQHIAYPLESALDERELIQALYDAVCGESYYSTCRLFYVLNWAP